MIDLFPTMCNLCGGEAEYIPKEKVYGRSYGSGFCYHCISCGVYVGTHEGRPKEVFAVPDEKIGGLMRNE